MPRIDPSLNLAALLRREQLKSSTKPVSAKADSGTRPREDSESDPLARISSLDPADPDRRRKAVRIYLESMLLSQLGPQLLSDPEFPDLVDQVQVQLEADSELKQACDAAADVLLRRSAGKKSA
jgi:hypothetical protein